MLRPTGVSARSAYLEPKRLRMMDEGCDADDLMLNDNNDNDDVLLYYDGFAQCDDMPLNSSRPFVR